VWQGQYIVHTPRFTSIHSLTVGQGQRSHFDFYFKKNEGLLTKMYRLNKLRGRLNFFRHNDRYNKYKSKSTSCIHVGKSILYILVNPFEDILVKIRKKYITLDVSENLCNVQSAGQVGLQGCLQWSSLNTQGFLLILIGRGITYSSVHQSE
jgi:hypothetical protein